jgi:hypothetical protein
MKRNVDCALPATAQHKYSTAASPLIAILISITRMRYSESSDPGYVVISLIIMIPSFNLNPANYREDHGAKETALHIMMRKGDPRTKSTWGQLP